MKKKFLAILLIFMSVLTPSFSIDKVNFISNINHDFSHKNITKEIFLKSSEDVNIDNETKIPKDSLLTAEIIEVQEERRWHKSGYFLCKIKTFCPADNTDCIDISGKNIYLVGKKYEAIDKKEAGILGTELVLTQAASVASSIFVIAAPIDIIYFFTKGAIKREKDPNWFKAGFYHAYDNSIFWFWFKGKPIDLEQNDTVKLKNINEKRALKITKKIKQRKEKQAIKDLKSNIKQREMLMSE